MVTQRFTKHFGVMVDNASNVAVQLGAEAMLVLLDGACDWERLKERVSAEVEHVIVAADNEADLEGAESAGLLPLTLNKQGSPLLERLQHALLEAVADGYLKANSMVVSLYSGFDHSKIDSISCIRLDDRLRRLTTRDLQRLESSVPLNVLKSVIDLASEIGREGREGKKVGTMFVVGDTSKVVKHCKDSGFDPMRGYKRENRNLFDPRVREDVKEIAQMDGAFIVSNEGVIERSRQIVEVAHAEVSLSKGLGARHWAGAAISQTTNAIGIVVSQSTGTVRLFQKGETVLRIEPMDRAVAWQELNYEPPPMETK